MTRRRVVRWRTHRDTDAHGRLDHHHGDSLKSDTLQILGGDSSQFSASAKDAAGNPVTGVTFVGTFWEGMSDQVSPSPDRAELAVALVGQFACQEEIGRGGMGVVYRARDRS